MVVKHVALERERKAQLSEVYFISRVGEATLNGTLYQISFSTLTFESCRQNNALAKAGRTFMISEASTETASESTDVSGLGAPGMRAEEHTPLSIQTPAWPPGLSP